MELIHQQQVQCRQVYALRARLHLVQLEGKMRGQFNDTDETSDEHTGQGNISIFSIRCNHFDLVHGQEVVATTAARSFHDNTGQF